jgi:hypothetical protein
MHRGSRQSVESNCAPGVAAVSQAFSMSDNVNFYASETSGRLDGCLTWSLATLGSVFKATARWGRTQRPRHRQCDDTALLEGQWVPEHVVLQPYDRRSLENKDNPGQKEPQQKPRRKCRTDGHNGRRAAEINNAFGRVLVSLFRVSDAPACTLVRVRWKGLLPAGTSCLDCGLQGSLLSHGCMKKTHGCKEKSRGTR